MVRREIQRREEMRFTAQVTSSGAGVSGLTVTVSVRRLADDFYWDGAAWDAAFATVTATEPDATNQPGVYEYVMPPEASDPTNDADGFCVVMTEPTYDLNDFLFVTLEYAGPSDGVPSAVSPVERVTSIVGSGARLLFTISTTDPGANHGNSGLGWAFAVDSLEVELGGDLTVLDGSAVRFIEGATSPVSASTTTVTADPTFVAGAGPDGEDVVSVDVDNSIPFEPGSFVRATGKNGLGGQVYLVLDAPTGTSLLLHSTSDFDLVDGDVLKAVVPSGVYTAEYTLDPDYCPTVENASATVVMNARTLLTGDGPVWQRAYSLQWTKSIALDWWNRGYTAG